MDEAEIKTKTAAAGISGFNYTGTELDLFHGGAHRKYAGVADSAALDAAIEEFLNNTPPKWVAT